MAKVYLISSSAQATVCFNRKRFNVCEDTGTGAILAPQGIQQVRTQQKTKTPMRRNGSDNLPEPEYKIAHP